MEKAKKKRLEKAGWTFGDAEDFLGERALKVEGWMLDGEFMAAYVSFSRKRKKGDVAVTEEVMPEVFVDLDKKGNVLGVEVLDAADLERAVKRAMKMTPDKLSKDAKARLRHLKERT